MARNKGATSERASTSTSERPTKPGSGPGPMPRRKGRPQTKAEAKAAAKAKSAAATTAPEQLSPPEVAARLVVGSALDLLAVDTSSTPGFDGGKKAGTTALADGVAALSDLQERLFAHGRTGGTRSVLLVLQGMDTSGKGGVTRHVLGSVDPQGVRISSFVAPTPQEKAHDFLWRIRPQVPLPGYIGIFDRSHYEDVLAVRVRNLAPPATWRRRYASINRFEADLVDRGVDVVKVMLHISPDEQRERLAERLERPEKFWKYRPADVDDRALWDGYQAAYADALTRCSTASAPWYVVPADHKWYARWAVQQLLLHHLSGLGLGWPPANFDVAEEKARLAAS